MGETGEKLLGGILGVIRLKGEVERLQVDVRDLTADVVSRVERAEERAEKRARDAAADSESRVRAELEAAVKALDKQTDVILRARESETLALRQELHSSREEVRRLSDRLTALEAKLSFYERMIPAAMAPSTVRAVVAGDGFPQLPDGSGDDKNL